MVSEVSCDSVRPSIRMRSCSTAGRQSVAYIKDWLVNGELLALAWWRCADGVPGDACARNVLEWLSVPCYVGFHE